MHRFFVERPIDGVGEAVPLPREESEHAARVLRLRAGEAVRLLDGAGLYDAELREVNDRATTAVVTAVCPSPEPCAQAVLWQGLPKADKLELIAQKATELGAWELWPVEMRHCVAKADKTGRADQKRERLARIALEAAKQSGRAHVPQIAPVRSFEEVLAALAQAPGFDLVLVAWEEERALPMSEAVRAYTAEHGVPTRVLIVIGPEGGISVEEHQLLREAGAVSVTLGKRILRTETAGLCALSVLWTVLGEM
ncbi:MAG: RsmE family RNA methyltransferase [Clostridia bacterium]